MNRIELSIRKWSGETLAEVIASSIQDGYDIDVRGKKLVINDKIRPPVNREITQADYT